MSDRLPPHVYFLVSAVFHYLGPAFAVLLFVRVDVLGVAWLRIAAAAAVFALWRRPWRLLGNRLLLAWGAVLAVMNCSFYLAIDRLPLATVAAIEFLPVVALAALGARTPRNLAALLLAVPGVYLLTGVQLEGEALGVALAFVNAGLFAVYIVLAHRVAQLDTISGIDGLAASMLIALVVVTPLAGWAAAPAITDPVALLAGVGVGISSSVIPYVSDQLAMRRLARATYALMVSLLPATATVIGIVVLAQVPSLRRGARRGARDRGRRPAPRGPSRLRRAMQLDGIGALVAGGASGLGEATARELAARGARVTVADLNEERGDALAGELGGAFVRADVTDEAQVQAAVDAVEGLRVAVSCAGIGWAERTVGKGGAAALAPFETVIRVNLIGTFNVLRLSAAAMSQGEPDAEGERGVVVMTASIAAFDGQIGQAAYSASKGGVVGLTLPAARDLARQGIRVCTIAPGLFDTPLLAGLPEEARQALGAQIPFPPRLGRPEEYARLACQIAENTMLNGETIRLDGAIRMAPR